MAAHPVKLDADLGVGDEPSGARVLRGFVVSALSVAPGPELVAALMGLTARTDLSAREWVEVAVAWKTVACLATAGQFVAVGELDRALNPGLGAESDPGVDGDRDGYAGLGRSCPVRRTADELAPALGMAPRAASSLVSLVRRCEDLPAAMDAVADGRMDLPQLRALDAHARHLPAGPRRALEAAAVRWAPRRTRQQLDAALAAEAIRLAPGHAGDLVEHGVAERDVQLRPSPLAGCRRLVADLPTDQAHAAWLALNGAARTARRTAHERGDERTVAQLRADLLTATLTGHDHATDDGVVTVVPSPAELSRHVEVQVVVAADTLTGHTDLPASIPGVGPLDPDTARTLATRQPWRRLIADPTTGTLQHIDPRTLPPPRDAAPPAPPNPPESTGLAALEPADPEKAVPEPIPSDPRLARLLTDPVVPARLDHGTDKYRPGAALRRHIHCRDASCIGPACHHPATGTDLDHTINYREPGPDGQPGTTSHTNLSSTCERIHNAKTHGGWTLSQPTPGTFTWTSPTGRSYTRTVRPLIHGWHESNDQA